MIGEFEIVICDDEIEFLHTIYERIENIMTKNNFKYNIIDFDNSCEFIQYCKKNPVDVILVDIDIPYKDGFTAVNELQKQQPDIAVIFVSAHEELAYQSFKYNPYQFVSKRDLKRLDMILIKLISKINRQREHCEIVHLNAEGNIVEINVNEVTYLKKEKNYMVVYGEYGAEIRKFRSSVTDIYNQLSDNGFICTNQSYIVNCRFIKNFERKRIIMLDNKEIKGSRNRDTIDEAQKLYGKFMREQRW